MKLVFFLVLCISSLTFTMNTHQKPSSVPLKSSFQPVAPLSKNNSSPANGNGTSQKQDPIIKSLNSLMTDERFKVSPSNFLQSETLQEFSDLLIPLSQNTSLQEQIMKDKKCFLAFFLLNSAEKECSAQPDKNTSYYEEDTKTWIVHNNHDNFTICFKNIKNEKHGTRVWEKFKELSKLLTHGFIYKTEGNTIIIDGSYLKKPIPFLEEPNLPKDSSKNSSLPLFSFILVPCAVYGIYSFIKTYFLTK